MGVSEVVEPDSRESAAGDFAVEQLRQRFGVQGAPGRVDEHRVVDAGGMSVAFEASFPADEDLFGVRVEINGALLAA